MLLFVSFLLREGSAFYVLTPNFSHVRICHNYGLTPCVEFPSSGSNYDAYLAKGPLQLLTDRMQ